MSVTSNGNATSECLMNMYDSSNPEMQEGEQRNRAKRNTFGEQVQDLEARLDSTVNSLNNVNPLTTERVDRMAASIAKLEHHLDPPFIDSIMKRLDNLEQAMGTMMSETGDGSRSWGWDQILLEQAEHNSDTDARVGSLEAHLKDPDVEK